MRNDTASNRTLQLPLLELPPRGTDDNPSRGSSKSAASSKSNSSEDYQRGPGSPGIVNPLMDVANPSMCCDDQPTLSNVRTNSTGACGWDLLSFQGGKVEICKNQSGKNLFRSIVRRSLQQNALNSVNPSMEVGEESPMTSRDTSEMFRKGCRDSRGNVVKHVLDETEWAISLLTSPQVPVRILWHALRAMEANGLDWKPESILCESLFEGPSSGTELAYLLFAREVAYYEAMDYYAEPALDKGPLPGHNPRLLHVMVRPPHGGKPVPFS